MFKKYHNDKFSATHIRLGVGLILHSQNKILLEKRIDCGNWGLVGGAVEIGESVEQSIIRECYEETSLIIEEKDLLLLGVYSDIYESRIIHYPDSCFHAIDVIYSCKIDERVHARKSIESLDIDFFYFRSLPNDLVPCAIPPINDFLKKYFKI